MTNHYQLGKEAILNASTAQLKLMGEAKEIVFATSYGSSASTFELALRRIGEEELAQKFVDPHPNKNVLVGRTSTNNDILTAAITNLERGNRDFAEDLERLQRQEFYMEGAGYAHTHYHSSLQKDPLWEERKRRQHEAALKLGIVGTRRYKEIKKDIETLLHKFVRGPDITDEERQRFESYTQFFKSRGKELPSLLIGGYDMIAPSMGMSLGESVYAVYVNLALDDKKHARKVLNEIFEQYRAANSELFCASMHPIYCSPANIGTYHDAANIIRAQGLAGDESAPKQFEHLENQLMDMFQQDNYHLQKANRSVCLALALDHFGRDENLIKVKEVLSSLPLEPRTEREEKDSDYLGFGQDTSTIHNAEICTIGLGLTGLEKGKPNYFYTA